MKNFESKHEDAISLGEFLDRANEMLDDEDYLKGVNPYTIGLQFVVNHKLGEVSDIRTALAIVRCGNSIRLLDSRYT